MDRVSKLQIRLIHWGHTHNTLHSHHSPLLFCKMFRFAAAYWCTVYAGSMLDLLIWYVQSYTYTACIYDTYIYIRLEFVYVLICDLTNYIYNSFNWASQKMTKRQVFLDRVGPRLFLPPPSVALPDACMELLEVEHQVWFDRSRMLMTPIPACQL